MGVQDYQACPSGRNPILIGYGMEVIIPVDICMPTLHTIKIDQSQNVIQLDLAKDQSEKRRQEAQIRIVTY